MRSKSDAKPDQRSSAEESTTSPSEYLRSLLPAKRSRVTREELLVGQITDPARLAAHDMELMQAVKQGDLDTLRRRLREGRSLDACNKQGETVLHTACRRGTLETVKFLVTQAQVPLTYRDEVGRTVLHDCAWRPVPDFAMMDFMIHACPPEMLVAEDVRGHSCMDYTRKRDWKIWIAFLQQRSAVIQREEEAPSAVVPLVIQHEPARPVLAAPDLARREPSPCAAPDLKLPKQGFSVTSPCGMSDYKAFY